MSGNREQWGHDVLEGELLRCPAFRVGKGHGGPQHRVHSQSPWELGVHDGRYKWGHGDHRVPRAERGRPVGVYECPDRRTTWKYSAWFCHQQGLERRLCEKLPLVEGEEQDGQRRLAYNVQLQRQRRLWLVDSPGPQRRPL